ncbi:MAG: hypothetical protein IT443_04355 [Phycisphaeraceae bacterium]|nr:hypothetical protein [Phycisphaeraceae bacterium]
MATAIHAKVPFMVLNRTTVRVQLDTITKQLLDNLCAKRGMTQIAAMSRLVNWFVDQNDLIQAAILGQLTLSAQKELARKLIEKAGRGGGK